MATQPLDVGDLVAFTEVKNARGYPATGEVLAVDGEGRCTVKAWGLAGPGSETTVNDVPATEVRKC